MTPEEIERVLVEIRDSNRQLAESSRQIAQSLNNIERVWTAQVQTTLKWTRWGVLPVLVVLLVALIPFSGPCGSSCASRLQYGEGHTGACAVCSTPASHSGEVSMRRIALAVVLVLTVLAPLVGRAQQPTKIARLGLLG